MIATLAIAALLVTVPDSVGPRVTVCGFDISGSMFALKREARAVCEAELMSARPGDIVVVRTVGAQAYVPGAEVVRVRFPAAVGSCSTFDTRCRAAAARSRSAFVLRQHAACAIVQKSVVATAQATDLLGFIEAASEELATYPGLAHRIVLSTDGDDNVLQRLHTDLTATEVKIVLLRASNSVADAAAARQRWAGLLIQMKAASVTIRPRPEGPRCSA